MASLQHRKSGNHKYWYIVESRRVNGKPRPIPIMYLGKVDNLLKRLQSSFHENIRCKSFAHGAVAALLRVAEDIGVIDIINQYIQPNKKGKKQIRDGLTVGASLTLRAIEKVCHPCSNSEFNSWAKSSSLEYLLSISCAKMDSQHFWDQMNELDISDIPKIEADIVRRVIQIENIPLNTLLLDATNFFTFINTTNSRCSIAQRGKNKKGRNDLRQVGILLVVSRKDIIPLFHETYEGNKADSKIFSATIDKITQRLSEITDDLENLTVVFDRGNNSKANLAKDKLRIHYVGALSPSQHKGLMKEAVEYLEAEKRINSDKNEQTCFRVKKELWGETRTLIVYRSRKLYTGQVRGITKQLNKKVALLDDLNVIMSSPRSKKRTRKDVIESVKSIVKGQYIQDILSWRIPRKRKYYKVEYGVDEKKYAELKRNRLGYRILMTNRHDWTEKEIISAYHGQSKVEYAFRNLENPYHGSAHPQYHWTDQKIRVHVFTCILGFLLESIIYKRAQKGGYGKTNFDNLFDRLERIRLSMLLEQKPRSKKMSVHYQLEMTEAEDELLLDALNIRNIHVKKPKLAGLVVYK